MSINQVHVQQVMNTYGNEKPIKYEKNLCIFTQSRMIVHRKEHREIYISFIKFSAKFHREKI